MNRTAHLVAALEVRGVRFELDGDALRYRAPAHVASDDLPEALRLHKKRIVRLLRQRPTKEDGLCGCGHPIAGGVPVCGACRARELGWTIQS
jgi:hypothetical protein